MSVVRTVSIIVKISYNSYSRTHFHAKLQNIEKNRTNKNNAAITSHAIRDTAEAVNKF